MGKKSDGQKISSLKEYERKKRQIVEIDWYKQSNLVDEENNGKKDLTSGGGQIVGRISSLELAMVRKESRKQEQFFSAYMTKTRLSGFCKVALIQTINGYYDMELFELHFDRRGVNNHKITQTIYQDDVTAFLVQGQYELITYQQALILIRDSSLQNYKYNYHVEALERNKSIHLQRATYREMQDDQGLFYVGASLTKEETINCVLNAIQNKDASLLYELLSQEKRAAEVSKDLFVIGWNHELEDIGFIKSDIVFKEINLGEYQVTIFILGLNSEKRLIQIELLAMLVEEADGYKIDRILTVDSQSVDKDKVLNSTTAKQFVGVFEVTDWEKVSCYLQSQKQILLSGEFKLGGCYKWLKDQDVLQDGVDLDAHYFVQMILTKKQLLVYSANLFTVNEAVSMLEVELNKSIFLNSKCLTDIGELYQSTLLEKGLYPQGAEKLEMQYFISGEHYETVLKLCFQASKMHAFHYTDEALGFYQQLDGDCLEILFKDNNVLINCFSKTLEMLAEIFRSKDSNELYDYMLAHSKSSRRLPRDVECLYHLGSGAKVKRARRKREQL